MVMLGLNASFYFKVWIKNCGKQVIVAPLLRSDCRDYCHGCVILISRNGVNMMTSSNRNIFRVTGPLCGEFTSRGEFPTQRPVTRSFDVFFDLRLNKRLSKQPWGWWFETPSWSLWRHCNVKPNHQLFGIVMRVPLRLEYLPVPYLYICVSQMLYDIYLRKFTCVHSKQRFRRLFAAHKRHHVGCKYSFLCVYLHWMWSKLNIESQQISGLYISDTAQFIFVEDIISVLINVSLKFFPVDQLTITGNGSGNDFLLNRKQPITWTIMTESTNTYMHQ